jgi:hypothetical protein
MITPAQEGGYVTKHVTKFLCGAPRLEGGYVRGRIENRLVRPLLRWRGILRDVKGDAETSQIITGIRRAPIHPRIPAPQERFPPVIPSGFSPENPDPAQLGQAPVPMPVTRHTRDADRTRAKRRPIRRRLRVARPATSGAFTVLFTVFGENRWQPDAARRGTIDPDPLQP